MATAGSTNLLQVKHMLIPRLGHTPVSVRAISGSLFAAAVCLVSMTLAANAATDVDLVLNWFPFGLGDPLPVSAALSFGAFAFVGLGLAVGGSGGSKQERAAAAKAAAAAARPNGRKSDGVEKHIHQELGRILGLIRSHLQASGSYSNSLTEAQKSLQRITTPEQLRLTVEALILENEKMRHKAKDLDQRLDQARGQIEMLRSNLAEAEEISLKDALTSLANRRSFDQTLRKEIEEAQDKGRNLCLVMGDIDHFKRINDTFGHLVGDAVLKRFAELLAKSVGVNDVVARFGGEEFAIIFPGMKLNQAAAATEAIRRSLESKKWVATDGGQRLGTVTASFGVAELHQSDDSETIVRRADEKLYEAKCSGRNKVVAEARAMA